jgi:hypothetical protein
MVPPQCIFVRIDCVMLVMHLSGDWDGDTYPILLEVCVVANDGGRVCAFLLPDLVSGAVGIKVAEVVGRRVVRGVVPAHCDIGKYITFRVYCKDNPH